MNVNTENTSASYEYKLIERDNDESNWKWATIGTIDDLLNMPDELVFKHSLCIGEGKWVTAEITERQIGGTVNVKREQRFHAIDHGSFETTILEILGNDEYYDFFDYFKNPVFCHHLVAETRIRDGRLVI
tara:strand:+ start:55 stop:444 length:390 start_codon:yes stop_codon:yes gene_type:complete